jgi:murein DD-endopeptidase MepM/ murein hydrolase activator NlpD
LPPNEPPSLSVKKNDSVAYWIPGALIAASLSLGIGITLFPHTAGAFWPFSILKASEGAADAPILHDSSINLLQAAINPDPSPQLPSPELAMSEGSALIASAGIDGTIEVDHTSSSGSISTYTVQPGDSISGIAAANGVSVDTILWANGLTRKSAIKPGTTLVILPVSGVRHTVAKGESLAGIAKKFGADVEDIASYNGIDSGVGLISGSVLIIPGGEITTPVLKKVATGKSSVKIKTGGSMGAVKAVGNTSKAISLGNPAPAGRVSQGIHGWNGIDFAAPSGSAVLAAAEGTVIVSRMGGWNGGYGNYIVIDHGDGTQTLYAHLSSDSVSVGQKVSRGQQIGGVGNTGKSTGYHLHFEVRGAKNPFAK